MDRRERKALWPAGLVARRWEGAHDCLVLVLEWTQPPPSFRRMTGFFRGKKVELLRRDECGETRDSELRDRRTARLLCDDESEV